MLYLDANEPNPLIYVEEDDAIAVALSQYGEGLWQEYRNAPVGEDGPQSARLARYLSTHRVRLVGESAHRDLLGYRLGLAVAYLYGRSSGNV